MLGTLLGTAVLSFYCLLPTVSPLFVILLIASLSFSIKLFLHVSGPKFPQSVFLLLAGLSIGSILSFVTSNPSIFHLLSISDLLVSLVLYVTAATLFPFGSILLAEILFFHPLIRDRMKTRGYPIFTPALIFSLSGIMQERVGVGRGVWWIHDIGENELLRWFSRVGGIVLVDFVIATAGFSLAALVWTLFETDRAKVKMWVRQEIEEEERDLLQPEEEAQETTPLFRNASQSCAQILASSSPPTQKRVNRLLKPIYIISFLLFLQIVAPIFASPAFSPSTHGSHPSTTDPDFEYPPISVGCVNLPRYSKDENKLEWILHETKRIASRGVKIISWEEAVVGIEDDWKKGREEGWNGMGREEKKLLTKVGEISEMYKTYILSTYSVTSLRNHKSLNVATLVGPSFDNSSVPRIVLSTTKHHPVTFIESYSHSHRIDHSLGSSPDSLPLATISIPHPPHTPHSIQLEEVSISTAICQDISYPSLLGSYEIPGGQETLIKGKKRKNSPQLILNPSNVPLQSLALSQIDQVRSRALEQGSWILRCDSSTENEREKGGGISGLIAPDGSLRVIQHGVGGGGSWSSSVDAELASGKGTPFNRVWGGKILGNEFAVWLWIPLAVIVSEVLASGKKEHWEKVKGWWEWVRRSEERLIESEVENGRVSDDLI